MNDTRLITSEFLLSHYQTFLLDAYGVLVNSRSRLPGAKEFLDSLIANNKNYFIVSNGSTQNALNSSRSFQKKGLDIPPEKIINSGSLVQAWISENHFDTAKVYILGPKSSEYVLEGTNCKICDPDESEFDLLIITNQTGFSFLDKVDHMITALIKMIDSGRDVHLLLPNPDLIYPGEDGFYGCTSGMIALCIEKALKLRYYSHAPKFTRLGKPFAPIFEKAKKLADSQSLVMIGDQLETDIKGANQLGIDSVLIQTGVSKLCSISKQNSVFPTYTLRGFI